MKIRHCMVGFHGVVYPRDRPYRLAGKIEVAPLADIATAG
jgi:hypothetical protein